jgi:hypothetical protein
MQPVLFWRKFEDWLRWYFHKGRPVAWRCSPFKERKGWLVICELLMLAVLNAGVAWSPRVGWAAVPLAVYIGVDILIANTVIVFLTGMGISPLRSVILTMFGYFNVALSFATLWILLLGDGSAHVHGRVLTAVYHSVRTLATAGPPMENPTPGQEVLAVVEMLIGIYFLVVIFAIYASWAKTRPDGKAQA